MVFGRPRTRIVPPSPDATVFDGSANKDRKVARKGQKRSFAHRMIPLAAQNQGALSSEARVEKEPITSRARKAVEAVILAGQAPSLGRIAAALSMPPRTFQRHLKKAGANHRNLAQQARFELARRLLVETSSPVHEVASKLGFADSSHFSRFFRRMSGVSPQVYRRMHQGKARRRVGAGSTALPTVDAR